MKIQPSHSYFKTEMRRYVLTHPIPIYAIVFHLAHNHRSLEIKYYPQNRSSGTVIQDGMARRKEGLMAFVEVGWGCCGFEGVCLRRVNIEFWMG